MKSKVRETARFRALSGETEGFGISPQKALEALMARLPKEPPAPIVILPYNQGDAFFTDAQQARLEELKQRRDRLTEAERAEWEQLVEASFDATVLRTQAMPVVKS